MEACEMLNRDPLGSSLPILVLSALESERERVLSSGKGIAGYLTKPVTKEELVKKIESLLNLSP
jgi:DNA-binding response OmpR family regulator